MTQPRHLTPPRDSTLLRNPTPSSTRLTRRSLIGLVLAGVLLPVSGVEAQVIPVPAGPDPAPPFLTPLDPVPPNPTGPDAGPSVATEPAPVPSLVLPPAPAIGIPSAAPAVGIPASDSATVAPASETGPAVDADAAPFRTWHFAEGNSRNGFETFFTLLNLSDQPASVSAQYNRDDGIRLMQWLGIKPHARVSLKANDIIGAKAFGASFFADQDVVVERTTTWGPGQNGETLIGFAPDGRRAWHFAEGTTRGRVVTYLVTQNLSDAATSVTATFTRDDGSTEKRQYDVPPRGRDAYRVNDLLKDTAFCTSVRADQDIVVERTIMIEGERPPTPKRSRDDKGPNVQTNGQTDDSFAMARNALGIFGGLGYAADGPDPGSRGWELAEGSTRDPYSTTFVLFNPGQHDTYVRFTFHLEGGGTKTKAVHLQPSSRLAYDPRDVVPGADFATSIESDYPIIAERVYASSGDGLYGALGYTPAPPNRDSRVWYFAEGNTTSQIEMFFILYNLSGKASQVRATYFVDGAPPRDQSLSLPAGGRLAVRANDVIGRNVFSTRFVADQSIVAERTLYLSGGSGFTTMGAGAVRTA